MRIKFHRWMPVGVLVALAVLTAACSDGDTKKTVTAVDYKFENVPSSVKAGTTLTLKNSSTKEVHEMVLIKLPDGEKRSPEELSDCPRASSTPWPADHQRPCSSLRPGMRRRSQQ